MQKSESNRVVSIILAIILVLFASLAAPKLPRSITKYLENPWLRFIIFIGIAYMATKDLVTAIIAVVAVMVSYQTLAIHKITDTVMHKTNELINTIPFPIDSQVPMVQEPVHSSFQEPVHSSVKGPVHSSFQEPVQEPVQESSDELKNQITFYVKDVISNNPNITNDILIKSLIEGNPHLNHDEIINSVNNAFLEKDVQQDISLDKMSINDNEVLFKTNNKFNIKKNTMKYLKGDFNLIPDEYSEHENIDGLPNLLTDSCTQKHIQNFNCNNIPKNTNENFNGYEYDFDNNGTF
jgi:hypothetical protein